MDATSTIHILCHAMGCNHFNLYFMTKVERFKMSHLKNEPHFHFHSDVNKVLGKHDTKALNLETAALHYSNLLPLENEAIQLMLKSTYTQRLATADQTRDITEDGFEMSVKSNLMHFDPEKALAAQRLWTFLQTKGNVTKKDYNTETIDINNIVTEMRGKSAPDVALLNLTEWVDKLDADNRAFTALKDDREFEASEKTNLRMKQVRPQLDKAFRALADRIDALVLLNGPSAYQALVNQINTLVEKYDLTMQQHLGRVQASETTPPAPPAR